MPMATFVHRLHLHIKSTEAYNMFQSAAESGIACIPMIVRDCLQGGAFNILTRGANILV